MSFLGFLGKAIVGTVGGLISGGPVGAIAGGLSATGVLGGGGAGSAGGGVQPASPVVRQPIIGAPIVGQPFGTIGGTLFRTPTIGGRSLMAVPPSNSLPASSGSAAAAGAAGASSAIIPCPKGHHQKKGTHGLLFPTCVKNRHMNVTNPKALRRALRRAYGFEKLAMRTIRLIHPKKRASFGGFKRSRRRR